MSSRLECLRLEWRPSAWQFTSSGTLTIPGNREPGQLVVSSNIFHDRGGYPCLYRLLWTSLAVVCFVSQTRALDPNRKMSEYIRNRWDAQQGFPGGPVYAITQTPDGYLWLGTEKGLVRFDGLNFKLFNQTNSRELPTAPVMGLLTDAEGNLWIRPQSRNLLRYRDGKFQDVIRELDSTLSGVPAMCLGVKGEALFSVRNAGVYAYHAGKFSEAIPSPNVLVISLAQTTDGRFW